MEIIATGVREERMIMSVSRRETSNEYEEDCDSGAGRNVDALVRMARAGSDRRIRDRRGDEAHLTEYRT